MEQLKVMQTQGPLCVHTQTHLFFLQPPISLSPPESSSGSLQLSLQLTMNKRYDVSQQALDLQSLRFDPGILDVSNSRAGEGTGICLGGRLRDGDVGRGWGWPWASLSLLIPSSQLLRYLITSNIEMVPNPRNIMAPFLQIHEKNMPKVRTQAQFWEPSEASIGALGPSGGKAVIIRGDYRPSAPC